VPELTATYGVPNACNECHDDKSPEWAIAAMDRWWGDATRRQRAYDATDAMYRAQAMDPTVLAHLATVMVDRSRSSITRASAAEFAARLLASPSSLGRGAPQGAGPATGATQTSYAFGASATVAMPEGQANRPGPSLPPAPTPTTAPLVIPPTLRNALIAAASDPEATVRAQAMRALSALGDRGAMPALTARLVDPARVVRTYAAEALAQLGVMTLPGNAGAALQRAQDEYAASLMTFGDNAGDHVTLGWFEMERRNDASATAALTRALRLSPDNPQPRVFLGVIAARHGDYAAAIREWKKVKSMQPSYPNIDRLIEEAERLRSVPGQHEEP
jgi:tetratricopeptide (TPR) repeat protein